MDVRYDSSVRNLACRKVLLARLEKSAIFAAVFLFETWTDKSIGRFHGKKNGMRSLPANALVLGLGTWLMQSPMGSVTKNPSYVHYVACP